MGDVAADACEGLDESFHLVEHTVDDRRQPGEGVVGVSMRQSFAQVAGDNALNALVDLDDTLAGSSAQYHTDRQAKKQGGNHTKGERPANDVCDLSDFVDIPSDGQHVAIRQPSRDQADRLSFRSGIVCPVDRGAVYNVIGLEVGRQIFQVTRDTAAVQVK